MRALAGTLLVLLTAPFAPACHATQVETATIEDAHFLAEDGSYELELPLGWQRSEHALTHDGWEQQTITFNSGAVLGQEGNPIDASAPQLLAAMQDQLEAQPGIELIECRAVVLDGLSGFRMHFRQAEEADETGTEAAESSGTDPNIADSSTADSSTEVVIYCAIDGQTLYAFSLESKNPATLARDLEALERLVMSFHRRAASGS
jgi:hypothetical protein